MPRTEPRTGGVNPGPDPGPPQPDPQKRGTYETAVREVIDRKAKGEKIEVKGPERPSNVINLMDALKQSLAAERGEKAPASAHAGGKASKASKKRAPAKAAKKVRKAG